MSSAPEPPAIASRGGSLFLRLAAELGIVILGVTVALWADGWAAERRDRSIETARLEALQGDVVRTLDELQQTREFADRVAEALRQLVEFTVSDAPTPAVQSALSVGLLGVPEFQPELGVYDDLRSSGELALFSDASLRQALSRMQSRVDRALSYQADLLTVQQLNVDPYLMRRFELRGLMRDLLEDSAGLEGFEPTVLGDLEARNLAMFKLDMVTQLQLRLNEAEEALMRVREHVAAHTAGAV